MSRVIGIDLGTVNSCVAAIENDGPLVLADAEGHRTTPSIYAVTSSGAPVVGYAAQAQHDQNRLNTIFAVKRLIGLKFESPEVKRAIGKLPYKIVPAKNGDAWVEIEGVPTSPEEVSSHVLAKMKEVAEHSLGEKVHRAVVTVPAHFNDSQRQATKDAARLAGLDILRVINEPTAAALAYGMQSLDQSTNQRRVLTKSGITVDRVVAVFDLGGGTFDVSILALRDGVFDVLSTQGDTFLGGEDFDLAIVDAIVSDFQRRTGVDLSQNRQMMQRLKSMARDAKHQLSYETEAHISLPYATAQHHLDMRLDRRTLEKIVQPIVKRMEEPCKMALEDAGLRPADVDETILVGGMTRMPTVKKLCRTIFGKEPIDSVDPDEAVALGAAIQGAILQGMLKGVSLLDVTSLSLGIEIQGGMVHTLIPRNTKIPVKATETLSTSAPNQPQVSIHVVQGESNFAPENKTLGRFELVGIRPAPRGVPEIEVTCEVDSDGIVHVSALDRETGEQQEIQIIASSGLSEDEIDQMLRESSTAAAQKNRIDALRSGERREEADSNDEYLNAENALRAEIYTLQFNLDMFGKNFRGNARSVLETCLVTSRRLLEGARSAEELRNTLLALEIIGAVFKHHMDRENS